MSLPFEIRELPVPARDEWLERIGRLRVGVWRQEGSIAEDQFRDGVWLDGFDGSARHWVVTDREEIVAAARLTLHPRLADSPDGYVWLDAGRDLPSPIANVAKLVVARRARRRGLATALNRARLEAARASGAVTATVTASEDNARLLASIEPFTFSGLCAQFADRPRVSFHALELALCASEWRVFVYGTLLRGERNHALLANARCLGEARTTPDFELAHLGSYPALVPGGRTAIAGEVYVVSAGELAALDGLEGHPHHYRRTKVELATGDLAEAYLLGGENVRARPRIASGDWRRPAGVSRH